MAKNLEIVEILRVFDYFWFFEPVEAYKPVVNHEELRAWREMLFQVPGGR